MPIKMCHPCRMAKWFRIHRQGCAEQGRMRRLLVRAVERARRRGVERLTGAPATEKVVGRLHRAASGLAEITSEVNAYAGLLEEKTGELRAKTRAARHVPDEKLSTGSAGESVADHPPREDKSHLRA
jgi:hypothetical protein